jgi:hypothetical protein
MLPIHSQVRPAATGPAQRTGIPIVAGIGGSNFSLDWGTGRMDGITAWIDYYPWGMPPKMHGLGAELEGRDLNFNRPAGLYPMRHDTFLVGPIYRINHYKYVKPYGKWDFGIGSIDFPANPLFPNYKHDTYFIQAISGGMDFKVYKHIYARGEYQYQWWHHTWGPTDLDPNGASFGVLYDFRPQL